MYCPGVQANSVQACNAGNVNACLNRGLESCAGFVVWLAAIPYQLANVAMRMGLLRARDLLAIKSFLDSFRET